MDEVRHHLLNAFPVCPHKIGLQVAFEAEAGPLCLWTKALHGRQHRLAQRHGFQTEGHLSGFDARQFQQFLDQLAEGVHFPFDVVEEPLGGRRVAQRAIAECVHQGLERGQRRSKFVGDVADEIPAHRLQPANVGEILQNHQAYPRPGPLQEGDDHLQGASLRPYVEQFRLLLFFSPGSIARGPRFGGPEPLRRRSDLVLRFRGAGR